MKKKLLALALPALLVLLALAACTGGAGSPAETFRNAKVLSVTGSATLTRDGDALAVYAGQVLRGGDSLTTDAGSQVSLKLDGDKYVVLEENTAVVLRLEGSPEKGAIRLHQTAGTVHHSIENPLGDGDSYEVHTPDAVMAVRGTDFSSTVGQGETGSQTTAQVREGSVEMTTTGPDPEARTLGPGEAATAGQTGDGQSQFLNACPLCFRPLEAEESHLLSCGRDHAVCDGLDHSPLSCGHTACAEGDHETVLSCGSLACAQGHGRQGCGHCLCAGGDHSLLPCGHYTCTAGDAEHRLLDCGNYGCRSGHQTCYSCGKCVCTGDHSPRPCGDPACAQGSHSGLPCGHWACTQGNHSGLPCGHYACDGKIHDAYSSCGSLMCTPGHEDCLFCGQCLCTGSHGETVCKPAA